VDGWVPAFAKMTVESVMKIADYHHYLFLSLQLVQQWLDKLDLLILPSHPPNHCERFDNSLTSKDDFELQGRNP
jgi:hypothetical protein